MSGAVIILDVSSWQHPRGAKIDWKAVKDYGVFGIIAKITQGTTYVSPYGRDDLWEAGAAGLWIGAYHFFEGELESAKEQAAFFAHAIEGEELELGAWLDWEPAGVNNWEAKPAIDAFEEELATARIDGYLYCDQSWHDALVAAMYKPRRWWAAAPSMSEAPTGAFMWQRQATAIPGIEGLTDVNWLMNKRAFNLPNPAPTPKPVQQEAPAKDENEHADPSSEGAKEGEG